jgi:hypothetical protein
MTPEHIESFQSLFDQIYKGDPGATNLSFKLLEIAHVWDDLVDKDPVSEDQINSAFMACLFDVQQNPLWFKAGLSFHMQNIFLRWRDANTIERDSSATDDDLLKCYMLRAGIYDVFVILAYHLHGDQWAKQVGPIVRKFYGETPSQYLVEMRNA